MIRHYTCIALVDLSYLFTRNYRGAGVNAPPNAGATRTLDDLRAIADDVDHVIVCLDTAPYLRRDKFPFYKAHREAPPPEEIEQKKAVITELRRRGYAIARARGHEADDVIATLARSYGEWATEVRIIASDKDCAQCITKNVIQYVPSSGSREADRRDYLKCKVKFGCYPNQMPLWQALVGDASDNVPGVKGIGEKKATFVLTTLTAAGQPATLAGLANFLATSKRVGKEWQAIADHWEALRTSLELVTLNTEVPLDIEGLLVKLDPEVDADDPMAVEGFEHNQTPQGSAPPEDAIELEDGHDIDTATDIEPPPPPPPALPSEVQRQINQLAAESHALKAAGKLDETGRPTDKGAANDVKTARPPVTEAEFDPISRAPGATGPLPPLPPPKVPEPAPAPPKAAEAPKAAPVTPPVSTAIVKAEENYGEVDDQLQPRDLRGARTLSVWFHKGGLYKAFGSPEAVFTIIARGKDLGLNTTTALAGFHMIEGKPSASADLIRSLAERDPNCEYFMLIESTPERATWETKHRRHPRPTAYTYTLDEAKLVPEYMKKDRWGLPGNWEKRPRDMLTKTAGSKLARLVYPGATLGLYCPEELTGSIDTQGVEAA